MTYADEHRWRQALRAQLAQRTKDDAQMQRRWERYVSQRRDDSATKAAEKAESDGTNALNVASFR